MAIDFGNNNASRYYRITSADELFRLPAADWCIGIWYRGNDNSGTGFQYLVSSGTFGGNNSFHLFWVEASNVSDPGTWRFTVQDGAGNNPTNNGGNVKSGAISADSTSRLLICQRNGTDLEFWITPESGTAVKVGSVAVGSLGIVAPDDIYIGNRPDLTSTRYYEEEAGGFFWARGALSQSEIEAIAAGTGDPRTYLDVVCYLDMRSPNATLLDIQGAGPATQNGTSWPAATADFPGVSSIFSTFNSHSFASPTQIASDGVGTWFSDPVSIRYKTGSVDKTWYGYCDSSGNVLLAQVNHNSSNAINVPSIASMATADDHFVPTVLVRTSDSKLMVFWGDFVAGALKYRVSTNPEEATTGGFGAATSVSTVTNCSFYSYPFQVSSGRIYVFYRGNDAVTPNRGLNYVYTDDDGSTWSLPILITDQSGAGCYMKMDQHGDDIYIALTRSPGSVNDDTRDVRVFVFNDQKLYDLTGAEIFDPTDYPVTVTALPAAYDSASTGIDAWIFDVAAHEGNPEIFFYTYPASNRHAAHWGRWDGSAWDIVQLTDWNDTLDSNIASGTAEPYYAPGGCLDRARPGKVIVVQGGKTRSGLTRFITTDAGATWTRWPITNMSQDHVRPRIPINHDVGSHDDFDIIFVRGSYDEWDNFTTSIQGAARAPNDLAMPGEVVGPLASSRLINSALLGRLAA